MSTQAIELLRKNWTTLRRAPFVFIMVLVIGLGVRWGAAALIYGERISMYNEIIADREQRLNLASPTKTAYSQLSNAELRQKALIIVNKIRDFVDTASRLEDSAEAASRAKSRALLRDKVAEGKTTVGSILQDEEMSKISRQKLDDSMLRNSQYNLEYTKQFKNEAILLEEAMSVRLPPESLKGRNLISYKYEHAYGILEMQEVANDLERLAKSLP